MQKIVRAKNKKKKTNKFPAEEMPKIFACKFPTSFTQKKAAHQQPFVPSTAI